VWQLSLSCHTFNVPCHVNVQCHVTHINVPRHTSHVNAPCHVTHVQGLVCNVNLPIYGACIVNLFFHDTYIAHTQWRRMQSLQHAQQSATRATAFECVRVLPAAPPQHTATHRNAPQHTTPHRNTPQLTATHRNTPQQTVTQAAVREC